MVKRLCTSLLLICLAMTFSIPTIANDPIWIDVRSAEEFGEGHVDQAINIPYEEIGLEISSVTSDKEATIYVYCRTGRRSGIARETLNELGYVNVVNIGGLDDALAKAGQDPSN